ncbi:PilZ domain-containing protein [Luteimonas sp BLCC-B24]|uniref:PilZ domain-containing protein n=1 Tax=Luteimonas sp. BLCC-B24 TaxID=3025317 RepID=UPI00234DBAA7|nr:PilZ domain-containing protein [Luteimonas sp. BLCC-B24]MDC7807322.1 PilZ domain-containing protein [Luteimonas sp. BLCC-B24]
MRSADDPPDVDALDARLFGDSLSCDVDLPVAVEPAVGRGRQAQAVALLSGLAQIEDLRKDDGGEEHGDLPLLAQRMDAKLDLILGLIGRLARVHELPEQPVRWSRVGLRVGLDAPVDVAAGERVIARLQPADWLPDHLELPAEVLASHPAAHGSRVWLAFVDLRPDLVEALDRHLFRLHRRQVAEQRRR